jgi:hypothetical protein
MNLLDAFAELDKLNEAYIYHGQYKSPYLNLSEAERQAAKDLWAKYSSKRLLPTSKGWVTPGWLDVQLSADSCKYILDYDTFHKAYDVEIADAGLLNMFDPSGELGPPGCYGNLKESGLTSKDSLYKVLITLWRWVHSEDERKKRLYTVDKSTADSMLQKATEEAEAYRKRQEAEQAKKEQEAKDRQAAEDIRQTLENLLPDALELVDQDLLDQLEETGSSQIDLGFKNNQSYLHTDKFGTKEIPKKAIAEYSAEFLASLITEYLTGLNLAAKIVQHNLGLDIVQKHYAHGYWLNTDTNEIYVEASDYSTLVNKQTGQEATPKELQHCTLALAKVSRVGERRTHSATEDVKSDFYYSYNEELVLTSTLQDLLPYERSAPLLDHSLTYYDNGFEEASKHGIFIDFPTFDVWLHESVIEYGNG